MLRWRWVLLVWLMGSALLAYGVMVELSVRAQVGSGLHRFLARMVAKEEILYYRQQSLLCAVGGPALIALGFVLRRRNGRKNPNQQRGRSGRVSP